MTHSHNAYSYSDSRYAQYTTITIYTIILLKSICLSVCLSQLANCMSQFLLDRLGRYLKLFVSTDSTSCHEFVSQFGLEFFIRENTKPRGNWAGVCQWLFQWLATSHCRQQSGPSRLAGRDPSNSDTATAVFVWGGGGCVHVFARVRASVPA